MLSRAAGMLTVCRATLRVCNAGVQAKVHKLGSRVMRVLGSEHDVVWVDVTMQYHAASSA